VGDGATVLLDAELFAGILANASSLFFEEMPMIVEPTKVICSRCHMPIINEAFVYVGTEHGTTAHHQVCPAPVDYKKILLAYIDLVGMSEGVDFVGPLRELTDEENAEFLELSVQAQRPGWHREHRLKTAAQFRAHKYVWGSYD
jgi:hypothetical protein